MRRRYASHQQFRVSLAQPVQEVFIRENPAYMDTIASSLLTAVAARYGIIPSELTQLPGGHFAWVYGFRRQGQDCILRITPPNEDASLNSTRQILEWLAFLADHGGPVSCPIRSLSGGLIEIMDYVGQTYLSTAFEKAPGILAEEILLEDWNDALFQALGRAVGSCHRIASQYSPLAESRRPAWDQPTNCFNPLDALHGADAILLAKRSLVLEALASLPKDAEHYGLAHMDLHFANFFVDAASSKITLFDFDDCAYGWYTMDLAMLLFDVLVVYRGADRGKFARHFLEHLLRGYLPQKSLDRFLIAQLPLFLKLLEIGLYIMLYRDYAAAESDGWSSKFMPGRRERIEQDIPYVDLDFAQILEAASS